MYCLRCGRETEDEQAFCLDCQKKMAENPVDPNAVVYLPVRKQSVPKKTVKRRVSPEEQVKLLKRQVRIYACLFLTVLILAACMSVPLIRHYQKRHFQIGQNYTTVKPNTESVDATDLPE